MNTLIFSIDIKAKESKIWEVLWNEKNYREWAAVFFEGSYIVVDNWEEGSKVHFLGPEQTGIYSYIETHIPNELIGFKHLGNVEDGIEQDIDEETRTWSGARESYSLKAGRSGKQTLTIEIDVMDNHLEFMNDKLPKALEKIKTMCG